MTAQVSAQIGTSRRPVAKRLPRPTTLVSDLGERVERSASRCALSGETAFARLVRKGGLDRARMASQSVGLLVSTYENVRRRANRTEERHRPRSNVASSVSLRRAL